MDPFIIKLLETSPIIAISAVVVHQISKRLFKSQDDLNKANSDRISALERHQIDSAKRHDECERDRAKLHEDHKELQQEVINRLSALLERDRNL